MDKKILATKGPKWFGAGEIVGMIFSGIMGGILLFLSPKELVIKLFSLIFIGCAIFCGYLAFSNIFKFFDKIIVSVLTFADWPTIIYNTGVKIMISYEPFFKTLKEKELTTYKLINTYGISSSLIDRLKHNKPITTVTINDLCKILDCGVDGILEHQKSE